MSEGADRYSRGTGNWNSTSIWAATSAGATGVSFPVAGDIVYIQAGHTITVPANAACASITVTGSGSSLIINATYSLDVSGNISLNNLAGGSTSFAISGAGSVTCGGNLIIGTTSLNPSAIYTHTLNSSVASMTVSGNITINSSCQNKNRVSNGVLAITGGIVTVNGTVVTTNEDAAQNIATLTLTTATLILKGLTPFSLTLTGVNAITLNGASSSLVDYNGAGAQAVYTTTYSNITLSGSGAKTLTAPTVNGILSMEGTATSAGTAPVYGAGATLRYKGSASQTTSIEFPADFTATGGVIIDNANGVSLDANRTITSSLNLTTGEFSIGSATLTLQTSNIPVSRISGTITTTSSSGISFGSAGNTAGNAFVLPSGLFTSTPASLNNLSIYRTNTLTLGDQMLSVSGIVLCNGPLATNGNLTLVSTVTGTALIDGSGTGAVTGNVTMQRYLATGGYKYFSSPFNGTDVSQFSEEVDLSASFPTFYGYNENDTESGWFTHTTGSLNNLEGYAVNFGALGTVTTVNVTGIVNNGAYSRTISNNNLTFTQGFNLIGNPFPSPIDWNAASGWTKTNIDGALYFFNAGGADQYSGTYNYYVSPGVSTGNASNIIPSMQAFFVHVTDGAFPVTGTIALNNSVRVNDLTHSFIKSDGEPHVQLLRLSAAFADNNESNDPLVIYFHEKGTSNFDSQLDAFKLINTDALTPNIYSIGEDGSKLAINALPVTGDSLLVIPLGIKTERDGKINFSVTEMNELSPGTTIYIHDDETNTDRIIDSSKQYTISLAAGEYNNRFSIRFMNKEKNIPDNWPGQDLLNAYAFHGKLIADISTISGNRGTLRVTNISGQTLFRKEIYNLGYHEFDISLNQGVYIITFFTGNLRVSKKIFFLNQ